MPATADADDQTSEHCVATAPEPAWRRATGIDEVSALWASAAGRTLVVAVGLIFVATLAGLVALWPSGSATADARSAPAAPPSLAATVVAVRIAPCPGSQGAGLAAAQRCRTVTVDPAGPRPPAEIELGPADGGLSVAQGDRVRVSPVPRLDDVPDDVAVAPYSLVGADHTRELAAAALLLALLAAVALRWRGLLALAGVALSLLLLAGFIVPSILAGSPPVLVALVGSLAVMFVTVVLTNGVGAQSLAGALGISLTLGLTTAVGLVAVRTTGLDGSGSELSIVLAQAAGGISLEGVLLAGMVVGGLGVLADTAVTQASAVMALRRAAPSAGAGDLYRQAVVVGRDHLSATIHTLVLAYAGATLPLLLVLHAGGASAADTVNSSDIAEPILATVIGCAGLIAAVPISTALAALLVARIPPGDLSPHAHGHHH